MEKRQDVNPQSGINKYGNVNYADEKNHKYPLDTMKHVNAAARYWGMPKNKAKYPNPEDRAHISAEISQAQHKSVYENKLKGNKS